jgi:hypothetical protein
MRVSCQRPVKPELCLHGEQRAGGAAAEALEQHLGSRGATRYQTVHRASREDWCRPSRPPWRGMEEGEYGDWKVEREEEGKSRTRLCR